MAPSASLPPQPTAARPSGSRNGRLCLAPLRRQRLSQRRCRGVGRWLRRGWRGFLPPRPAVRAGDTACPRARRALRSPLGRKTSVSWWQHHRSSPACSPWPARRLTALKRTRCHAGVSGQGQNRERRATSADFFHRPQSSDWRHSLQCRYAALGGGLLSLPAGLLGTNCSIDVIQISGPWTAHFEGFFW